ncbi:MAG: putative selenate reductase subunit YgfK [Bacteroidales bacterium]|nr:putative selenate reductase subunit YgfK [Bacteroidales bacterium]
MTDKFTPTPIKQLLQIILKQIDASNSLFGIQKELFFIPRKDDSFRSYRFGQLLETPIGVAAGPHTQLSQNIVAAWLTGARYIELKTVQTLDELEVSKPCIDMQDEGYNCEWSQELKLSQSFDEYLNAWILIHILKDKLNIGSKTEPGFIFNMSVGYNMEGIMQDNVQWFFEKMNNASAELEQKINEIKDIYPNVINLNINSKISDNITLSTMHGCPPHEIEQIGEYLITERKIHTTIKLNPTLLGKKDLSNIIKNSGFNTDVPDIAFEHDLKYPDAVKIIKNLTVKAKENDVFFGLKLTNTLESINNKNIFPENEKMMYASGKVLHPISINVARKLQNDFNGELDLSFSGGADAFNVKDILQCGLYPVTVCSDLLKPGGYGRLVQYIENITECKVSDGKSSIKQLNSYADSVLSNSRYKKDSPHDPSIKTSRQLGKFDCSYAPCEDTCPTNQGIPSYMYYTAKGEFEKAYEVIKATNPFPNATGMVCDHTCQTKCTRINYDNSLLIRDIKRFVVETHNNKLNPESNVDDDFRNLQSNGKKVSIIGAGPSGLSCAYFLKKAGFEVEIYETKSKAGGMVAGAIPKFRITDDAINIDINSITDLGVKIHYNRRVTAETFSNIKENSDFIYIAAGAQDAYVLNIPGSDTETVLNPLDFLFNVKSGNTTKIGKNVIIIGGGNTAMDAARTAYRLVGETGKVTIVYRRTIKQMPAEYKEIKDVTDEGIEIVELVSPLEVKQENGKLTSLKCIRMKLGEKDESGRARPVEIKGSEFEITCDTVIPAVGQSLSIDFIDKEKLKTSNKHYETKLENVFIGGDALRGASTIINAVGDGRKVAQEIINKAGINFETRPRHRRDALHASHNQTNRDREPQALKDLMLKKAKRTEGIKVQETDLSDRKNFNLVTSVLSKKDAMQEASRCSFCDEVCNICTTLCPNLALQHYELEPVKYKLQKVQNNVIVNDVIFEISQKYQIIHIADWCNQCANCETFCPSSGAPYKEKPHLYLDKTKFAVNKDGYFFDKDNQSLLAKENGFDFTLKDEGTFWHYQTDNFIAKLDKKNFKIIEFSGAENEDFNLRKVAEMSVILKGVLNY